MKSSSTQLFSGAGLGLMLGVLLGLSSAPVVAVVVGAIAALLGSIVLPQLPGKPAPEGSEPQRRSAIDLRAGAFGLACVVGIVGGIWLRTHDLLSPKAPTLQDKLEQWKAIGFAPEEARALVVRGEGLGTAGGAAEAAKASPTRTLLFGDPTTRCAQVAPGRFASVDAAISAYDALGEAALARVARGLNQKLPGEMRMTALAAVVEASCNGA